MAWVYASLAVYCAGFALFWPRAFLIVDEERYASQALAFARGGRIVPGAGILFPPTKVSTISDYPPATSLLQTPFVWAFGWRGAALLSVLGLIVATLVTARWLRESGRSPAFALLIPGFFGSAFFGRIAMSDVPSMALVALTFWLIWRAGRGDSEKNRTVLSLLAGFCAGASLLFREPLVLLLAPLLAGAALRRRIAIVPMVAGGITGVALRFVLATWFFGSPFYVRDPNFPFALSGLRHSLPVYGIILLIMFPLGALLPFFYRGERRIELIAGVAAYFALFALYDWNSFHENGVIKGLILSSRYMAPLAPVLAFMAADVWPRWHERAKQYIGRLADHAVVAAASGAFAVAFAVHPLAWRQDEVAAEIVRGIYAHTSADAPVITNTNATLKYLSPSYGARRLILRYDLSADSVAAFAARYPRLSVVLLDRSDNPFSREEAAGNAAFLAAVQQRCRLDKSFEQAFGGWAELHVYEVRACR
jgi:hypothetical protein